MSSNSVCVHSPQMLACILSASVRCMIHLLMHLCVCENVSVLVLLYVSVYLCLSVFASCSNWS